MLRIKRKPSAGKEAATETKHDGKQKNERTQTKNVLSFLTSDISKEPAETPKDSGRREEQRMEDTMKDAGRGEEEKTQEILKDSGREEEVRTVKEAMKDYGRDDEDDEVLFPLSGPGFDWYRDKGVKLNANVGRTEERMRNSIIMEDNEIKGLVRGSATGSLSENIDVLIDKLSSPASSKQQDHLSAMMSIGYFIINNGPIIPTQVLAKKYKELKALKDSTRIESARLLEVLTKHLNVVQIYIEGKGYILENHGPEIVKIVNSFKKYLKR